MGTWARFLNLSKINASTLLRRRRMAVCIIVLMLPTIFIATQTQGVFYSRADVLFLPPQGVVRGNQLQADPAQTLSFAAIVEHRINAERPSTAPRSTSAPLFGTGSRNSHAVYIPSSGGQWQFSFSRPVITVEVVADSAGEVTNELKHLVRRISELSAQIQTDDGIPSAVQITTDLSPDMPFARHIRVRNEQAVISLVLLTLGLAVGIPLMAESLTARRSYTAVRPGSAVPRETISGIPGFENRRP